MSMRFLYSLGLFLASLQLCAQGDPQPELVLPSGHSGAIRIARFSPDNKYVITGGEDRVVNIWEAFTGVKIKSFRSGLSSLKKIGFSPNGKAIFVKTDSTFLVWSFPSFREVLKLFDSKAARMGSDGSIYSLSVEGVLEKFDHQGKKEWGKQVNGTDLFISPDALSIAVSTPEMIYLFDSKGKESGSIKITGTRLVEFVPGKKSIVVLNDRRIYRYRPGNDSLESLAFAPDKFYQSENGRFLVRALFERPYVAIFDIYEGKDLLNFDTVYSRFDSLAVVDTGGDYRYTVGSMNISAPGMREVFNGMTISNSGEFFSSEVNLWQVNNVTQSYEMGYDELAYTTFDGSFSSDSRYLLFLTSSNEVGLWDLNKKSIISKYKGRTGRISAVSTDREGRKLVAIDGKLGKIISVSTGKTLHILARHKGEIGSALFSPDGTQLLTNSYDTTACLWDVNSGRLIEQFRGFHYEYNPVYFDQRGDLIKPELRKDSFWVTDVETLAEKLTVVDQKRYNPANFCMSQSRTGKYVYYPLPYISILTNSTLELSWGVEVNAISPDEKTFVVARPWTDSLMIGDPAAGKWIGAASIGSPVSDRGPNSILQLLFSGDGRYLFVTDINKVVTVLDVKKGFQKIRQFSGEQCRVSEDGDLLVILNEGRLDLYNIGDLEILYSYISMSGEDFLVLDEKKRYDGTPQARKSLYFTCETEVIALDQFKDRLWVPDLASRILSNDSIYTTGIEGLNICGYTPKIEQRNSSRQWDYEITPGKGGLGETVVFVNGVEVKRYLPGQLVKKGASYQLRIDSTELRSFYLAGTENLVTVRSHTADNAIASRGLIRKDSIQKTSQPAPNLYALMIGVSDYKGDELDLRYAAKDANDLSQTIKLAAGKLLNTDGKDHVFIYPLTTGEGRYRMPEKAAIQKTIEEIGSRATPNDILLVFFAGHGVMEGEKKQFYFLTSEASGSLAAPEIFRIGITPAELIEWIRPSNVKAQKRILIFDACNSGEVIRDFVKLGREEQGYVSARNDDKAQQLKQIEKLNDRAGFTILSAAASNQSAYEMGRYSQGILTYALLKTVKEQPSILTNGNFLDINRWFEASRELVEVLARNDGARQEPQLISNTNFAIGIVDDEVHSSIKLPVERPIFGGSIVVNTLGNRDDLRLSRMLNAELSSVSALPEGKLIYIPDHESKETYLINGSYSINGSTISMELVFTKGDDVIATRRFEGQKESLHLMIAEFRKYLDSFPN